MSRYELNKHPGGIMGGGPLGGLCRSSREKLVILEPKMGSWKWA